MFFINIRDLNAKIVSGQVHRSVGFSEKVQKDIIKRQENRRKLSKPIIKPEPEQVQELLPAKNAGSFVCIERERRMSGSNFAFLSIGS
jgi:hypothetical protein